MRPMRISMSTLEAELVEVALREQNRDETRALRARLGRLIHDRVIGKPVRLVMIKPATPIRRPQP